MSARVITSVCGVLGGSAWVARYVLDRAGTIDGTLDDALHWGGTALLAIALLAFGIGLVSRSAVWLRLVVGVAFPALVWSVLEVLRRGDELLADAIFGAVVVVVAVIGLTRARRQEPYRHTGTHSR